MSGCISSIIVDNLFVKVGIYFFSSASGRFKNRRFLSGTPKHFIALIASSTRIFPKSGELESPGITGTGDLMPSVAYTRYIRSFLFSFAINPPQPKTSSSMWGAIMRIVPENIRLRSKVLMLPLPESRLFEDSERVLRTRIPAKERRALQTFARKVRTQCIIRKDA